MREMRGSFSEVGTLAARQARVLHKSVYVSDENLGSRPQEEVIHS